MNTISKKRIKYFFNVFVLALIATFSLMAIKNINEGLNVGKNTVRKLANNEVLQEQLRQSIIDILSDPSVFDEINNSRLPTQEKTEINRYFGERLSSLNDVSSKFKLAIDRSDNEHEIKAIGIYFARCFFMFSIVESNIENTPDESIEISVKGKERCI